MEQTKADSAAASAPQLTPTRVASNRMPQRRNSSTCSSVAVLQIPTCTSDATADGTDRTADLVKKGTHTVKLVLDGFFWLLVHWKCFQQQQNSYTALIQLLPILLAILLSMASSLFISDPAYSLQQSKQVFMCTIQYNLLGNIFLF